MNGVAIIPLLIITVKDDMTIAAALTGWFLW